MTVTSLPNHGPIGQTILTTRLHRMAIRPDGFRLKSLVHCNTLLSQAYRPEHRSHMSKVAVVLR